jgi:hypothetical protein
MGGPLSGFRVYCVSTGMFWTMITCKSVISIILGYIIVPFLEIASKAG